MNEHHLEIIYRQAKQLVSQMEPIDPKDDIAVVIACRSILVERERCAMIADAAATEATETAAKHPEDSESRYRMLSRARGIQKVADDIRSGCVPSNHVGLS